jgi:hypothetical protein
MRANKNVKDESILQVPGDPGFPFRRFRKNLRAVLLQNCREIEIRDLTTRIPCVDKENLC